MIVKSPTLNLKTENHMQYLEYSWTSHWDDQFHQVMAAMDLSSPRFLAAALRLMADRLVDDDRTHQLIAQHIKEPADQNHP